MLNWNKELWLIDHGASFYFHHSWNNWEKHANGTFPLIKDHVMLERASELEQASQEIKSKLTPEMIDQIVDLVPNDFLIEEGNEITPMEKRKVYSTFIKTKIYNLDLLTKEANDVRKRSL